MGIFVIGPPINIFWVTIAAAVAGGISVSAALISALVGYKISDLVQSDADRRIAEAEKKIAPRQIQRDVFLKAIDGQPKARVEILYLRDDPECFDVAQQFWRLLQDARWDVAAPVPIPSNNAQDALSFGPTSMSVSGQPSGVTIAAHSISKAEADALTNQMFGKDWMRTPFTVLAGAIGQSLGRVSEWAAGPNAPPDGTLRIVVAPKP